MKKKINGSLVVDLIHKDKLAFYLTTDPSFTMDPTLIKKVPLAILSDAYKELSAEILTRSGKQ